MLFIPEHSKKPTLIQRESWKITADKGSKCPSIGIYNMFELDFFWKSPIWEGMEPLQNKCINAWTHNCVKA